MAEKYTDRIKEYCESHGIDIPTGFYRHPASRYAAIDTEVTPPKLLAKTWFNREDVAHYLIHLAPDRKLRILDFKDRKELILDNSSKLNHASEF